MFAKLTLLCFISLSSVAFCNLCSTLPFNSYWPTMDDRQKAATLLAEGNFNEAWELYRKLLEYPAATEANLVDDYAAATNCLVQLQRVHELDSFRENLLNIHPSKWRLHQAIASSLLHGEHFGYIVAGEFHRGHARGSGQYTDSTERDRVRSLQILIHSRQLADADGVTDPLQVAGYYYLISEATQSARIHGNAWRLQSLTDLETLPDYDINAHQAWGRGHWGGGRPGWSGASKGAPVDAEGNPIFYPVAASWDAAKNDGERSRWANEKAATLAPQPYRDIVDLDFARFTTDQFGVQTMAEYGALFREQSEDNAQPQQDSPFAVSTLKDDETICRLATGIKRIQLPAEFNHVRQYQNLTERTEGNTAYQAHLALGSIYENRQQYPTAAEHYRQALAKRPDDGQAKQRLDQITLPWGSFESVGTQAAGKGASFEFRFRNARQVKFVANQIDINALLKDLQQYLKSNPEHLQWEKLQLESIGYSILQNEMSKYVGAEVAKWELPLAPRANHFDRRISVSTPLQKAGAYLVTAQLQDGNTCSIVLWVADTAIARKQIDNNWLYMVVDAESGQPLPKCNLEFFGWKSNWNQQRQRQDIEVKNFAEIADENGFVEPSVQMLDNQFQWMTIARTPAGRLAFLGMNSIWRSRYSPGSYQQLTAYGISDRPIYRPSQSVKYKFWLRNVSYQSDQKQEMVDQQVRVQIYDPQGNEFSNEIRTLDRNAAFSDEFLLPENATLGAYTVQVSDPNRRKFGFQVFSFRVEEYKKPEFEVIVKAPEKPARLGDSIPVKIAANYYFGGPVAEGVVKYKVHRTKKDQRWYPIGRWDWLYGNGYLWLAADYEWYPGFSKWGCFGPIPPWWGFSPDPPELVLDEEGKLNADGTLEFEIDTAIVKAVHGNDDHDFSISVEVVDSSRRTITGSGNVMVARRPFSVYVWSNHGYARVGTPIEVSAQARTADGKGVAGKGKLVLHRIVYDADGKPTETELQSWDVATDEDGRLKQTIKATEAGQYRLAVTITDANGETIEGGQLLHVVGQEFDSANFRYNDLEILVEQAEYAPGDKVRLLLNTNRAGARLLVWERPQGIYAGRPKVLTLEGKSSVYEMTVAQNDMPNFFVEVMTVFGGKVHSVTKEIYVPPVSKVVQVELLPAETKVLPGAETEVQVKLTDPDGKPFTGSLVMTMYDRAIEYISGGSNVADIREHFWKWKRHHHPNTDHSLNRTGSSLVPPGKEPMGYLGVFGAIAADVVTSFSAVAGRENEGLEMRKGASRGAPGAPMPMAAGVAMDAAMEAAPASGESLGVGGGGGAAPPMVDPVVRTNFADAAYWSVDLKPNAEGIATATIKMPENLTSWKIRTWALGSDTSVGEGTTEIVTAKNIMVRLQAPRFFVEKDEVVLSAIVHNYLEVAKQTEVSIDLSGDFLHSSSDAVQRVEIPAGGQQRVDWRVKVMKEGNVDITMAAKTDVESDAMKMTFPVLVHGMLKTESFSGIVRQGEANTKFKIRVPSERRPELTRLEVRYSPTLAGAMVDALPYLNDYPYGCTEQTLNRFLPTLVTLNVLKRMKLDLQAIKDKQTNLNAQEIGDDVERAAQRWAHRNSVFDEAEVLDMAKEGIASLTKMQNSDGGWGWFSGSGERSWPHTTATVVRGLHLAKSNEMGIVPGVLENGVAWLKRYQDEQIGLLQRGDRIKDLPANHPERKLPYRTQADNQDALVYLALVEEDVANQAMADYLYRDRIELSLYGKGLAGLAFHLQNDLPRRDMLIQNIGQFVKYDDENQSAYIDLPNQTYWWYWWGDSIEANAIYLKLMAQAKPNDKITLGLVKYLINNRRNSTYWKSTRDTALCVEAFADFIKASGEDTPEMTVEVLVDGAVVKTAEINSRNLFQFDNKFVIEGVELTDGDHEVEIRRTGKGTVYTNAYLTNFTKEDEIKAAGLEIKVQRQFYRLEQIQDAKATVAGDRGQAVDQKVEKYKRIPLQSLAEVRSGDLLEVELEIDSKNDYEYVIFEDLKAAGCEPVQLLSGYLPGGLNAYAEFRDQRVAFFARTLARGKHSVSYRLRAEIPGQFSALPTKAWAMYAPELKANSDEMKLKISDREDF